METVKITHLKNLPERVFRALRDGQREAARVWTICRDLHLDARRNRTRWPGKGELQTATKNQAAIHSQSIQMVCHAFLANVEATKKLKKEHPEMRMKYPWRDKKFYPLMWPAQAVKYDGVRITLPMGRGRSPIILKVVLDFEPGSCRIVWNDGYELHVAKEAAESDAQGNNRATVDLGQIHQAAVTTNTGAALIVSGRGIRSEKRLRNKAHGEIASLRARCMPGSRRWRKLTRARRKITARSERRCRDLQHKGTAKVIAFCAREKVGEIYVGNPDGVQRKNSGRKQNQRMSQWEFGRDINYLEYKAKKVGIRFCKGPERGTSSTCPMPGCGHRQKVSGRRWRCRKCGFEGHRDLVGSANMHPIAYGTHIEFPTKPTYLRAGAARLGKGVNNPSRRNRPARSSRPDAGQSCPRLGQTASTRKTRKGPRGRASGSLKPGPQASEALSL